jgi:hypothetical protein
MPKRSSKRGPRLGDIVVAGEPLDINQIAALVTSLSTDAPAKNPNAVALGKLGGKKGGPARAKALSKKRRSEIARAAAKARWKKRKA